MYKRQEEGQEQVQILPTAELTLTPEIDKWGLCHKKIAQSTSTTFQQRRSLRKLKVSSALSAITRLKGLAQLLEDCHEYRQILPTAEVIIEKRKDKRSLGCNKTQKGRASHVGKQYGQIFRTAEVFLNRDNDKQSRGCNKT